MRCAAFMVLLQSSPLLQVVVARALTLEEKRRCSTEAWKPMTWCNTIWKHHMAHSNFWLVNYWPYMYKFFYLSELRWALDQLLNFITVLHDLSIGLVSSWPDSMIDETTVEHIRISTIRNRAEFPSLCLYTLPIRPSLYYLFLVMGYDRTIWHVIVCLQYMWPGCTEISSFI